MLFDSNLPSDLILSQNPSCDCQDTCTDPLKCSCLLRSNGLNYLPNSRKLHHSFSDFFHRPIYECNADCSCAASCSNRLVQNSMDDFGLLKQIDTAGKGLGVCASRNIEAGEFVCIYKGVYINPGDAVRISFKHSSESGHVYVLQVREFAGDLRDGRMVFETVVDGACDGYGDCLPISSLINHSCNPNLTVIPVRVDSVLPILAFFAKRSIPMAEEVAYDYGEWSGGNSSGKRCLCGAETCRGFLPSHNA
nr:histone lysine N methyltransferase SETMAR [Hymenolepis microstoma]